MKQKELIARVGSNKNGHWEVLWCRQLASYQEVNGKVYQKGDARRCAFCFFILAELFQKDRTVIGRHICNVYNEGELEEESTCAKFAHTTRHGAVEGKMQMQEVVIYNLDVVISILTR